MYAGAIVGNAGPEVAKRLFDLGALLGDVIQIHDDILDALEKPANPDWKQMRNNLLFLYAQTADHPDRERFLAIRSQVADPEMLTEAQKILLRCGAVSYGMYHLCQRYTAGMKILDGIQLADPLALQEVVVRCIRPLVTILKNFGIAIPPEIELV
jgi:geranylgeranyl pyrophosphate synthase